MRRRHYKLFLGDMLSSAKDILEYVGSLSQDAFIAEKMRVDAVSRKFEIIGEAASRVPIEVREKYTEIEWRKVSDFRNVLIHEYFGINQDIMWDVIQNKLPALVTQLTSVIAKES